MLPLVMWCIAYTTLQPPAQASKTKQWPHPLETPIVPHIVTRECIKCFVLVIASFICFLLRFGRVQSHITANDDRWNRMEKLY